MSADQNCGTRDKPLATSDAEEGAAGSCLIDPQTGDIVATDSQVTAWLGDYENSAQGNQITDFAPGFLESIEGPLAELRTPIAFSGSVVGPEGKGLPVRIRVSRLLGDQQDWLLVQFKSAEPAASGRWSFDALTGLADRRALSAHRARWRRADINQPVPHALLFLDLDGFKRVNDGFGHPVGDQVLAEIAARLRHCVRDGDLVARYGGDEFVILLGDVSGCDEVEPIISRLRNAVDCPVQLGEQQVSVSISVGVAFAQDTSDDLQELLSAADSDMYAAKRRDC